MKKKQAQKKLALQKIKILSLSKSRGKDQAGVALSPTWETSKESYCPDCHYFPTLNCG